YISVVVKEFFFFQAEDGIRDRNVTGVQTCALPISRARPSATAGTSQRCRVTSRPWPTVWPVSRTRARHSWRWPWPKSTPPPAPETGRASCKERRERAGGERLPHGRTGWKVNVRQ